MILFVGPLPPPVHGFAVINRAMLSCFQTATPVAVFNRAPEAGRPIRMLLAYLAALWSSPRGSPLYIGLSGGWGQLKDLPYLLAARLLGRPVLVHHHSFAYLRDSPWHARCVLGLLRPAQHITLCACMAELLSRRYRIPLQQVEVLSNAAFLPAPRNLTPRPPGAPLRIGFLSNITAEKCIWVYFELLDALLDAGQFVEGWIAGPVAVDIQARFQQECAKRPSCRHLGAVYGDDKQTYFDGIDVLAFPTNYANEAEPVTILEALSAGVPVVANALGCIAEMLPREAGAAYAVGSHFAALAATTLQAWLREGPQAWGARRHAAQAVFAKLQADSVTRLALIVARSTGGVRDAA